MSKISKTLVLVVIMELMGQSLECKCPKQIKGKICGEFLKSAVKSNSDCKPRTVYSCPGGDGEASATEEQSCDDSPCFTNQDMVTALIDAYCFPKFPYLLNYEKRKLEQLEEVLGKWPNNDQNNESEVYPKEISIIYLLKHLFSKQKFYTKNDKLFQLNYDFLRKIESQINWLLKLSEKL